MNAIAMTPRAPAKARKSTKNTAPSQLQRIGQDLARACAMVIEIADRLGPTEAEIGTLLDVAHELASPTPARLSEPQGPAEVFDILLRPLAMLQGAAAMARAMTVDVFSDAISRAYLLMDECRDSLDSLSIDKQTPAREPGQPLAPAPIQEFDARAAWITVGDMLEEAYKTDEAHERSGESDRLLRIASDMASRVAAPGYFEELVAEDRVADEMAHYAFDIAALINAARLVPGDDESIIRRGYIDAAARLLHRLARTESVDALIFTDVPRPPARDPKPITRDTTIDKAGKLAHRLVLQACWDLDGVAHAALDLADELDMPHYPVMRCLCARIVDMNSLLMSYLTDDQVTMKDAHAMVYGRNAQLPEGELKP